MRQCYDTRIGPHTSCILHDAKNVEVLKCRGYYLLLPLWIEYPGALRKRPAPVVWSVVRPFHVVMVGHAGVHKHLDNK